MAYVSRGLILSHQTGMHNWNIDIPGARDLQLQLAQQVITADHFGPIHTVAGTDVGFEQQGRITRAAVVLLRFPELEVIEYKICRRPTTFPYVPGYLSFREAPALLEALQQLSLAPDLLLCDGQGIAHPRRFGIACHLGVLTGIPAIGVAKSRLLGSHREVANTKGSWQPLEDKGDIIGAVLRSRVNVKPIYISPGHNISLPSAINYVLDCLSRYRLPETTRWADGIASQRPAFMAKLKANPL